MCVYQHCTSLYCETEAQGGSDLSTCRSLCKSSVTNPTDKYSVCVCVTVIHRNMSKPPSVHSPSADMLWFIAVSLTHTHTHTHTHTRRCHVQSPPAFCPLCLKSMFCSISVMNPILCLHCLWHDFCLLCLTCQLVVILSLISFQLQRLWLFQWLGTVRSRSAKNKWVSGSGSRKFSVSPSTAYTTSLLAQTWTHTLFFQFC